MSFSSHNVYLIISKKEGFIKHTLDTLRISKKELRHIIQTKVQKAQEVAIGNCYTKGNLKTKN